jgi:hypothetical protein
MTNKKRRSTSKSGGPPRGARIDVGLEALRVLHKFGPEKLCPASLMAEVGVQARTIVTALKSLDDLVLSEPFPSKLTKDPELHQFFCVNPARSKDIDRVLRTKHR